MMWPKEEARAKARMSEGRNVGQLSTSFDASKTRDEVATRLGVSGRSLEKAIADDIDDAFASCSASFLSTAASIARRE